MRGSFVCFNLCFLSDSSSIFSSQTLAIGYKQQHPDSVVVVQAYDPRPSLRIKNSEDAPFRRYYFVDAILKLEPASALGLLDPDFKVALSFFVLCFLDYLFVLLVFC